MFDQPGNPNAQVINNGSITVGQAGLAALVAPGVANNGVIAAKLGNVVLGGAQTYTLDFYGDGLIQFNVGAPVSAAPLGPDGKPMTSLVSNSGTIDAPGGTVLLSGDAAVRGASRVRGHSRGYDRDAERDDPGGERDDRQGDDRRRGGERGGAQRQDQRFGSKARTKRR